MSDTLKRLEFDILDGIFRNSNNLSNLSLKKSKKYSSSEIEEGLKVLRDKELIKGASVSDKGFEALEPYRAKRAVFIAAGFGTRLVPVTLNTPKPLVRVNGKRIIDGLIDAVLAVGIKDIVIVRGYLAEQFDQLLYKYPMVRFLENPAYNETNNISSAMCARYLFSNAYLFESDLLLNRPELITRYQYSSNFLGYKLDRSDDWCFTVENGYIKTHKIGGINCYQEFGISYWDEESGRKLSNHLKEAYEMPGGKEIFWTQVPLTVFHDEYAVEVRECHKEDITEIDTFRELKAIDKSYDV